MIASASELANHCRKLQTYTEGMVVEGVGGWLVPLNERHSMADLARALQLPVVLVVSMRLGCINHALLTAQSVAAYGLPLAGWIANHLQPDLEQDAQLIAAIGARIDAPILGNIPYLAASQRNAQEVAAHLDLG